MKTRSRVVMTALLVGLSSYGVSADIRAVQKTQVQFAGMLGRMMNLFGGKAAREGTTSTVVVKGDRKLTATDDTGQIVDLAEEKVYDLDFRRKTYKVTTFAEIRRQMEEAEQQAAAATPREERREQPRDTPSEPQPPEKEAEIDFDLKATGETKTINGFNTRQVVMTIAVREKGKTLEEGGGLVLTSDMWLAPEQTAMREVAEFELRYAQKLYGGLSGVSASQMAAAMAMYPMLRPALERLTAEGSKADGTAILTTMKIDAVTPPGEATGDEKEDPPPAARGIGGMIGGLARRAARKNEDPPKTRTTFMTSTVEVLKLSTDVAADDLAVPAGFKQVK